MNIRFRTRLFAEWMDINNQDSKHAIPMMRSSIINHNNNKQKCQCLWCCHHCHHSKSSSGSRDEYMQAHRQNFQSTTLALDPTRPKLSTSDPNKQSRDLVPTMIAHLRRMDKAEREREREIHAGFHTQLYFTTSSNNWLHLCLLTAGFYQP